MSHVGRAEEYFPPPETSGGWRTYVTRNIAPTAAQKQRIVQEAGIDWDQLVRAWQYSKAWGGNLLVIRHGWIVGEWGPNEAYGLRSAKKAMIGLNMMKLIDLSAKGQTAKPITGEDYAYPYLPPSWGEDVPERKLIAVKHLMTMSSGLDPYDGPYGADYPSIVLSRVVVAPPQTEWAYSTAAIDLLNLIAEDVSGVTVQQFFNTHITAPLGIPPVAFSTYWGGPSTAMKARNLARIGYLLLHGGAWAGQQVVSAELVTMMTAWAPFLADCTYKEPNFGNAPNAQHYYGYTWWTNRTGERLGPLVPVDAFQASGSQKNTLIVVPSLDLIVVRQGNKGGGDTFYRELMARVMAAVSP